MRVTGTPTRVHLEGSEPHPLWGDPVFFFSKWALETIAAGLLHMGFPGDSDSKASAHNMGDQGLIPRSGRSPGGGNGNPLQYSCLENSMDGGAWWAIVYGVVKSQHYWATFHFHLLLHMHVPRAPVKAFGGMAQESACLIASTITHHTPSDYDVL